MQHNFLAPLLRCLGPFLTMVVAVSCQNQEEATPQLQDIAVTTANSTTGVSAVSGALLLAAAKVTKNNPRKRVLLGVSVSKPEVAAFKPFLTLIAPRKLELPMVFQNLDNGENLWWTDKTLLDDIGGDAMYCTISPSTGGLKQVLNGSRDTWIAAQSERLKAHKRPVLFRLAHEFNGIGWNPYGAGQESSADFIAAWRYYHTKFAANGVTNLLWFWCPNIWGPTDNTVADPTAYYPGDAYVDFTGLDGYATPGKAYTPWPKDLFLSNYKTLTTISSRPFILGEFGVQTQARLTAAGGKAEWYRRLFKLVIEEMPRCVAICNWERGPFSTADDLEGQRVFVAGIQPPLLTVPPQEIPLQGFSATFNRTTRRTTVRWTGPANVKVTASRLSAGDPGGTRTSPPVDSRLGGYHFTFVHPTSDKRVTVSARVVSVDVAGKVTQRGPDCTLVISTE